MVSRSSLYGQRLSIDRSNESRRGGFETRPYRCRHTNDSLPAPPEDSNGMTHRKALVLYLSAESGSGFYIRPGEIEPDQN